MHYTYTRIKSICIFVLFFLSAFYLYVLSCTLRVVHINNSVHVPHFCLISDRHCSYFAGSGVRGAWYLHGGISGKRSAGTFLSRTTKNDSSNLQL